MSRRLLALALSLLLLASQHWGTLHLLSHGLHGGAPAVAAGAHADGAHAEHAADTTLRADAGDALCQVCLVLAALGVAGLPALWRWLRRPPRAGVVAAASRPMAARRPPAPWHARGPPVLH